MSSLSCSYSIKNCCTVIESYTNSEIGLRYSRPWLKEEADMLEDKFASVDQEIFQGLRLEDVPVKLISGA